MSHAQTGDHRLVTTPEAHSSLRPPISNLPLPPLQMAKRMEGRIQVSFGELQNYRSPLPLSSETRRYSCVEVLKQAA